MTLKRQLAALGACKDATRWATKYSTLAEAWDACERGDWMLWLVSKTLGREQDSDGRKRLVFAACQCARLGLPYTSDARVLATIETTERWTTGQSDMQEVRDAAHAAAYAAYAADAAHAAHAAANAAHAARIITLSQCADIIRPLFLASELKG